MEVALQNIWIQVGVGVQANSSHRNDLMTCDQPIGRDNQPTNIAVEIERKREIDRERERGRERERERENESKKEKKKRRRTRDSV